MAFGLQFGKEETSESGDNSNPFGSAATLKGQQEEKSIPPGGKR
ncbi:hypothetical protein SAMN04489761_4291 [Tenacibaculum sp. MAR_2009_124]|nr:hypothetical protein [Tenacibaculum sp. MAR_2009_124]SED10551.1 hypothetical protein SAMN04489761_4291 [Tenacibaculum sp. MAR_2009_124]